MKWNDTYSLISQTQTTKVKKHIEESLLVAPLLRESVVDLGSGGGFPGIPIAITNPQKKIYLVERKQAKAAFLLNTINRLELENTKVINADSRELNIKEFTRPLDIISRAFGPPKETAAAVEGLLKTPDTLLKMMKTKPAKGLKELPKKYKIEKIEEINLKGKEKEHILVTIRARET